MMHFSALTSNNAPMSDKAKENLFRPTEGSDQPVCAPSLVRIHDIRLKKQWLDNERLLDS